MTRTAVYQAGPWNQTWQRRWWYQLINGGMCRCGHGHAAHAHYRAGSACSFWDCPCGRYRRKWFK